MRFGIRSAIGIIAIYGVLFAAMRPLGTPGIVAAIVSATAISGVIIFARRKKLVALLRVAGSTLMGAVLGLGCLSPMILSKLYGYDHGSGETANSNVMGSIIGAIVGAFVASLITHSQPPRHDSTD